jgi:hypothetical protein
VATREVDRRKTAVKRRMLMMVLGALLALGMAVPAVVSAKETPPPSQEDLGELGAKWWQWAFRKPVNVNPLLGSYEGGAKCAGGKAGKVWFLAGVTSEPDSAPGAVVRTCHAPANKSIFFPVFNVECSVVEGNDIGPGTTEENLRACASGLTDIILETNPDAPFATVDGQDVLGDISDNRAASGLFTFTLPKNNADFNCPDGAGGLQQCPPGPTQAVTDGVWVLLPPLPRGTHTIHFGGTFELPPELGGGTFTLDVTYILTVKGRHAG